MGSLKLLIRPNLSIMTDQTLTKKELKKMRKLEKKRERERTEQKQSFTKWIIAGLVIVVIGFFILNLGGNRGSDAVVMEQFKGNPDASVVVTEYSDFQCPACAGTSVILEEAFMGYEDRVKIVFRHFPLVSIHPNAIPAARAAEAAGQQSKFWQMHDMLFEEQNNWANETRVYELFESYAEELGLNLEQFEADYNSRGIRAGINEQRAEAIDAGFNSTPTILINGNQIENPGTVAGFQALFDQFLSDEEVVATDSAQLDQN